MADGFAEEIMLEQEGMEEPRVAPERAPEAELGQQPEQDGGTPGAEPKRTKPLAKKIAVIALACLASALAFTGILFAFAAAWYIRVYGDQSFSSILFTLTNNTTGTSSEIMSSFARSALIPAIIVSLILLAIIWYCGKTQIVLKRGTAGREFKLYPFRRLVGGILALVVFAAGMFLTADKVNYFEYLAMQSEYSNLYEDEYVDPTDVSVAFPSQKRNLVYIYVESLETSFFSVSEGGLLEENAIPELYDLAWEYDNFSQNDRVGGFRNTAETGWTVAGMVAQSAGLQLKLPNTVSSNNSPWSNDYLTQATTITDILHENGYRQAIMMGSDSEFGSRGAFYKQHGVDEVFDLYTAYDDGIVSDGYYAWWGFEDMYLYRYAKRQIAELSRGDEPFAFFMLTADTHFPDGYKCSLCQDEHEEQYENVYSCTSRQINAFIQWLQQQPCWENTTVVITGDHITMDNEYTSREFPSGNSYANRYIYDCFINAAFDENGAASEGNAEANATVSDDQGAEDEQTIAYGRRKTVDVADADQSTKPEGEGGEEGDGAQETPDSGTIAADDRNVEGEGPLEGDSVAEADASAVPSHESPFLGRRANVTAHDDEMDESTREETIEEESEDASENANEGEETASHEDSADTKADQKDASEVSKERSMMPETSPQASSTPDPTLTVPDDVEWDCFKNRQMLTFDMFPTTLASLGCSIEGNRLGLGTNLYSRTRTVAERLGFENVQAESKKSSHYFENHFWK